MGSCAKCCVALILLIVADSAPFTLGDASSADIQDFLEQCEREMVFNEQHKDVVLVLGITGAGKTTFVQRMAGDDSKLISVEVSDGEFIIQDNNRIGNSTIHSMTSHPELVVDKETGTAYYDTPGFGDTRGVKNDIATSYFIKRIIDYVDKVKIVLVTSYPAVREGGDRKEFIRLLKHFVELVKNTERYLDGVGLIVTKVDNIVRKGKPVGDNMILGNIVKFLNHVATDIIDQTDLDLEFRQKVVKIIDKITTATGKEPDRIAIFRTPDESGPLSSIPASQEAKLRARAVISNNLKFITKYKEDFRYTVSAETKYKILKLFDSLKISLEENVKTVVYHLQKHYENQIIIIQNNLQSIDINSINKAESDLKKVWNLAEGMKVFNDIFNLASNLSKVKNCEEIALLLNDTVTNLRPNLSQQIMTNVFSEASFLDFINDTSILKFEFNTSLLQLSIQDTGNKLQQLAMQLKQSIKRLSISFEDNIKKYLKTALVDLEENISQIVMNSFDLTDIINQINTFYKKIVESQEPLHPEVKISKINTIFISSKIEIPNQVLQKIKDPKYDVFFKNELNKVIQNLNGSQTWYGFLDKLYNKLSSYDVQNNRSVQAFCKSFIHNSANYIGKNVENTNIQSILRDCSKDLFEMEFDEIKNVNLTQNNIRLLNNVVDITLNDNSLSHYCNNSKLVVRGRYVKFSEVNLHYCNGMSDLEIIGLEKVFMDKDLDFSGHNVTIVVMAPHWVIIGDNRQIVLDGLPGKLIEPKKAAEGQDGRPGMPGGNAGNFLGYSDVITDSKNLYISANGGNGSPGQAGGDGKRGKDGDVPYVEEPKMYFDTSNIWESNAEEVDEQIFACWKRRNYAVVVKKEDFSFSPDNSDNIYETYRIFEVTGRSPCSNGGDGGHGGLGGEGGAAGLVRVPHHIKSSTKSGKDGVSGQQGRGGKGGQGKATITVHETGYFLSFQYFTYDFYEMAIKYDQQCSSGKTPHGFYNAFERNRAPRVSNVLDTMLVKSSSAISQFKAFLSENMNNTFRKKYLLNVLSQVHL